jgi:membrane associated rhomboid family serine protease
MSRSWFASSVVPFRLVFIMWLVFSLEFFYRFDFSFLGIRPRSLTGLIGIFTAPMVHENYLHLLSNTVPLIFLGAALYFFYGRIAASVFTRCYFVTNVLVWIFSPRVSYHIGASGLIYGLASFLIVFGLLRMELLALLLSISVAIVYGGIFYGVLPTDSRISWESHLAGAITGVVTAFQFRQKKRVD